MKHRFDIVAPDQESPIGGEPFFQRSIPEGLHKLEKAAPRFYLEPDLATAINVALCVGQPLLLTGEPGTGKTQVAYYLAWSFGTRDNKPHVLPVKSTTTSRDLLYSFDTVAYFRTKEEGIKNKDQFISKGPLWEAFLDIDQHKPAVVLIDEIDKAPRDFPNDLLFELDQFSFRVPELEIKVERQNPKAPPPLVIITSNSERRLPEPFLRRCVFHHIQFSETVVRRAVERRRTDFPHLDDTTINNAVNHLLEIRKNKKLKKFPATAELLSWLRVLDIAQIKATRIGETTPTRELPYLNTMIKDRDDLQALS